MERVAALELAPGLVERTWEYLQRGDVLVRLALCVATVVGLWMVTAAWSIPLGYRRNYTPVRDIVANVKFKKADHDQTMAAKTLAARKVTYIYDHDKEPLVQLRAGLQNSVVIVAGAKSLSELDKKVWLEFFPAPPAAAAAAPAAPPAQPATAVQPKTTEEEERQFQVFHDALSTPESLAKLERAVAESMAPAEQHGLIEKLAQDPTEGNQQEIVVLAKGDANRPQVVKVSDVLIGEADWLKKGLAERLDSPEVAERIFTWLRRRLPSTLALDHTATNRAKEEAVAGVEDQFVEIIPGESIVKAGHPLTEQDLTLLTLEHEAYLDQARWTERLGYSMATLGMFVALGVLCGAYVMHYRAPAARQPRALGHHLGADRRHRRPGRAGLGRRRAGRAGAAGRLRHDAVDRLPSRPGTAVRRGGHAGGGGGDGPGPQRVHDPVCHGGRRHPDGGQYSQPPQIDLRGRRWLASSHC